MKTQLVSLLLTASAIIVTSGTLAFWLIRRSHSGASRLLSVVAAALGAAVVWEVIQAAFDQLSSGPRLHSYGLPVAAYALQFGLILLLALASALSAFAAHVCFKNDRDASSDAK